MKKLLPLIIWLVTSLLGKTWRFRVVAPPGLDVFNAAAAPKIYCFWHYTLLVISYMSRNTGKTAMVSRSRDGRLAADVAGRWGHEVIFGSSSKGGASVLRQGVRTLRAGRSLGITPDGPKGPPEVAKPGAAQIAFVSRTPVVTIKVDAVSAWRLKSWDRFMIPKPFAKITVTVSEPIEPSAAAPQKGGPGDTPDSAPAADNDAMLAALTRSIQESLTQ